MNINYLKKTSDNELIEQYYNKITNENKISKFDCFSKLYSNFDSDLDFVKKFYNFEDEDLIYNFFFKINLKKNQEYNNFDFIVKNYYESVDDTHVFYKNIMIDHYTIMRNITNYNQLFEYNNKFQKKFIIYNENTFYEYYKDFDLKFYKKKYYIDNDIKAMSHYHLIGKNSKNVINDKIKIIIYTPHFNIKCGGIVILHYLAYLINNSKNKKFYAKIFIYDNLKYDNIFCNDFAKIDEVDDNTIVIYPEIIKGNPLNCKNVIRWILLGLGIEMPIDHYINWDNRDLVYHWESSNTLNKFYKQLCCPWLNPIIKKEDKIKDKTCFLIKKATLFHSNINYMHPTDSINIDNLNLKEIINIFNESTYFYCYDLNTAYSIFAPICNCVTILYPSTTITKDEYFKNRIFFKNNEVYDYGISYGNNTEDIQKANETVKFAEDKFRELFSLYDDDIESFLSDIENNNNTVYNYYKKENS
jgi:hypothetical protein